MLAQPEAGVEARNLLKKTIGVFLTRTGQGARRPKFRAPDACSEDRDGGSFWSAISSVRGCRARMRSDATVLVKCFALERLDDPHR